MNEIIFQTENITKSYKQVHVLDHVNMTVKRGEIYEIDRRKRRWENNVDPLVNRTGQSLLRERCAYSAVRGKPSRRSDREWAALSKDLLCIRR